MFRIIKLTACAALLTAFTTTAHANLVVIGTPIDEPEFFSTTLEWTPGQTGDAYVSPFGANWIIAVLATVVGDSGVGAAILA